jgi:biotin transport system substrate-specific component
MASPATQVATRNRFAEVATQLAVIVAASFFVAACARIYVPLPGTPVPLTMQNLGVLLVGLALGSRRGFAALVLYLVEGVSGLPVFSPVFSLHGISGIAQILGPTGGYLIAYPFVAALTGFIFERGKATFARGALASFAGEVVLFTFGIGWLYVLTHSFARALTFGLYWFIFAEVIKIMLAAGAARSWQTFFPRN